MRQAAQGVEHDTDLIVRIGRGVARSAGRRHGVGARACARRRLRRRAVRRALSLLPPVLLSLSALLLLSSGANGRHAARASRLYRKRTTAGRGRTAFELLVLLPESAWLLSECQGLPRRLAASISATAGAALRWDPCAALRRALRSTAAAEPRSAPAPAWR